MSSRPPRNPFELFGAGGVDLPEMPQLRFPHPPRRFWFGIFLIVLAAVVIFLGAPLVGAITDFQWFAALGYGKVFTTRLYLQLVLLIGGLVMALAFTLLNLWWARRTRGRIALHQVGISQPGFSGGPGLIALAVAIVLAVGLGLTAQSQWEHLLLFFHPAQAGIKEPVFNLDVGFYLVQLPFLQDLQGWFESLVFITLLIILGLYTWRGDRFDFRLGPRAIAHLSLLLALMALILGAGIWLSQLGILSGKDSVVSGAGFTDVHARLPLMTAQLVLTLLLAVALLANLRFRLLWVALGCFGIWIVGALVVSIYPALVQTISVQPAELSQEQPYIQREIAFSRHAYGLDKVQNEQFGGDQPLTSSEVAADQTTINNLRLWDAAPLQQTYTQLQSIRTYYSFPNINLDRYTLDGNYQQVEIAGREIDQSKLQAQGLTWVNQRLEYTHGYSVAASPVAKVTKEGLPQFVAKDIPTTGPLQVGRPQIYFGQLESDYVIAPSRQPEFDYPNGSDNVHSQWTGTNAPQLNWLNRGLWALRTGDFNLLVSSEVTDSSRMLYRRGIQDRVQALAPFLTLNDKPYIVAADGHLYWIQDALVQSDLYPYSQADKDGNNYVRNSVKAVVDAYDGSVSFYISDPSDPVIQSWSQSFPGMFKSLDQLPASLRPHLRVPVSLFNIQADIYATYHINDPATLYNREDIWSKPLDPYYVMMRLPGESQPEYLMILPYTPLNKQNLVSWLAVRQDGSNYGQIVSYVLSKDKAILGPNQVSSRIDQTPEISRDYTLLNQSGSQVIRGNLLAVPIGNSFLYFEPWYLNSTNQSSLPELKKVILTGSTDQSPVAYQDTLEAALNQLTGEEVAAPSPASAPASAQSGQIAQLISQAKQQYDAASAALQQGDFAGYGTNIKQLGDTLAQIANLEKSP